MEFSTDEKENPSILMHLLNTSGVHAEKHDPEPCQTKPNSDCNHSFQTDSAPNLKTWLPQKYRTQ